MKNLMVDQIREACQKHKFISVRFCEDNSFVGINCQIVNHKRMKSKPNVETNYISYKPISFMEYISLKTPFTN